MNYYADLYHLKELLEMPDTDDDFALMAELDAASRHIELETGRTFSGVTAERYFTGAGRYLFPDDDILSISEISVNDGDDTFTAMAAADYHLYPMNKYPKTWLQINSLGDFVAFPRMPNGVKITGLFGCNQSATPYRASGITGTVATTTGTVLTLSAGDVIRPGHTILCESEQMFVESITAGETVTATVIRGVNGTAAAIHSAKALSIWEYPADITKACLITAMRWWKRKDSAFQTVVGTPELGQVNIYKGLDPDVVQILSRYRRTAI
ncbi:MAG: hypothetical protein P3T54_00185 [Dehalogenimonas sp.]|nr:hypothetical protein [Dehalogenimonas sp.]